MTQLLVTGYLLLRATLRLSEASSNAPFPVNYSNVRFCFFSRTCTRQACVQIAAFVRNGSLLLLINLTLTLLWWVELARLWGRVCSLFSGSMFNLSPQILSECACIQANRSHKKEKLYRLLRTASLRFADFLCARVCWQAEEGCVRVYVVCCMFICIAVCAPKKGSRWMEHVDLRAAVTPSSHLCTVLTLACRAARASVCLRVSGVCGESTECLGVYVMAPTCPWIWRQEKPLKGCTDRFHSLLLDVWLAWT